MKYIIQFNCEFDTNELSKETVRQFDAASDKLQWLKSYYADFDDDELLMDQALNITREIKLAE